MNQEQKEEEGLPTAAKADYCKNCGVLETIWSTQNLSKFRGVPCEDNRMKEIKFVRRKGIVDKLVSSIEAGLKFRDRYEKGSPSWRRYNHAVNEKLAILRFVAGLKPWEVEAETPENMLEELLEEAASE